MQTNLHFAMARIRVSWEQELAIGGEVKYITLYRAIKNCILRGELPHNWGLPATRVLAATLQLSRTTVLTAYELLQLEKIIVSKLGSGYRVHAAAATEVKGAVAAQYDAAAYPTVSDKGQAFLQNITIINRQPEIGIAFKPGLPPMDIFPVNKWKNLLNTYWRYVKSSDLSYGPSSGTSQLKQQICNYLNVNRSIKVAPNQIVVVSGSLQSLYLIASALINKGDSVALENPTFPNVHSIFKSFSAQLVPVALNAEGINLNALKNVAAPLKLVHVTPSNHYPFGIKMSLQRRLDLLAWAAQNSTYLVENDYEHELGNAADPLPTLFSLDQTQRTIYLGTFNRLLYPSIRLGYMVVPPQLVPVVAALQEHSHRFVSPALQMVMSQFIEKNCLFQHLKTLAEVAQERHANFAQQFEKKFQTMHLQAAHFNSLHMVATFKQPTTPKKEQAILQQLTQHNLSAFSLSKCFVTGPPQTGLILGYSTVRPATAKQKLKQMGAILNAC